MTPPLLSRAVSLWVCALSACALGCQQPHPASHTDASPAPIAANAPNASTAPSAAPPADPTLSAAPPAPPAPSAPTDLHPAPFDDSSPCFVDCLRQSQMKAVAISQIEAECRQACAPPAGHVAHAPMQHSPEEGCPMQADHAQADGHAQHHPDHLRPFPSTAEYVAHLDRADRAEWQKPEAVIAALSLAPDAVVADLGAGSGYFSFRLAASLPAGRVVALDIDPEMVRHIHHKAMTENISNVQAKLADPAAPMIPPDTTLALVVDVLHHVPSPPAWVAHVASQLKPGAQLAVIEFRMGDVPVGPPDKHKISKERLLEMAQAAGLTLAHDHDAVLPYQHLLIFQKP